MATASRTSDDSPYTAFPQPDDLNAAIWRYLDFAKFAWMMFEGRLFMPRCEVLAKTDPFEGSTPIHRIRQWEQLARDANCEADRALIKLNLEAITGHVTHFRQGDFISCWHMSQHESDAMWRIYGTGNNSVAIRSTYAKLKQGIPSFACVGCVRYIDYEKEHFPDNNLLHHIMHKRLAFKHENEIRAVVPAPAYYDGVAANSDSIGYFPTVNLTQLIEQIYVHALADEWFLNVVKAVVNKSGHDIPVVRSCLAAQPVF